MEEEVGYKRKNAENAVFIGIWHTRAIRTCGLPLRSLT